MEALVALIIVLTILTVAVGIMAIVEYIADKLGLIED